MVIGHSAEGIRPRLNPVSRKLKTITPVALWTAGGKSSPRLSRSCENCTVIQLNRDGPLHHSDREDQVPVAISRYNPFQTCQGAMMNYHLVSKREIRVGSRLASGLHNLLYRLDFVEVNRRRFCASANNPYDSCCCQNRQSELGIEFAEDITGKHWECDLHSSVRPMAYSFVLWNEVLKPFVPQYFCCVELTPRPDLYGVPIPASDIISKLFAYLKLAVATIPRMLTHSESQASVSPQVRMIEARFVLPSLTELLLVREKYTEPCWENNCTETANLRETPVPRTVSERSTP